MSAPLSLGTLWDLATDVHDTGPCDTDPRPLIQDLRQLMDLAPMGQTVLGRALDSVSDTDFAEMYLAEAVSRRSGIVCRSRGNCRADESDFAPTEFTAHPPRGLLQGLS